MKVVYIFSTSNASYILNNMVLPQLENDKHPVTVSGMFFFADNNYMLVKDNPTARRLALLVKEGKVGFVLGCDQCCMQRNIEDQIEPPFGIGCFPTLYARAGEAGVDQVITL